MTHPPTSFAGRIVDWQRSHGRSGLPWQATLDPYRVWLSEVMLQQTQVSTVLGYYARFVDRFADVRALASASQDDVFALWSGLGYYSRARNLHACAQQVVALHGGEFPRSAALLETLPGIGRSTAAAIAAFCFGERVAILDGNVKRVLTRVLGFDADLSQQASERRLWTHAQELLPQAAKDMPTYTQGLMDLGATVCHVRQPQCLVCPVQQVCIARVQGDPERLPVRSRRLRRSAQSLWLLRALRPGDGAVWLHKRAPKGVWAGLYCLPMFDSMEALRRGLPVRCATSEDPAFVHVLTHKDLHLHPVRVELDDYEPEVGGAWFSPAQWGQLGLPAPIRKLLDASVAS